MYQHRDLFIEKIVKRQRGAAHILLSGLIALSALSLMSLMVLLGILLAPDIFFIGAMLSVAVAYIAYRLITGISQEYEYTLTNDEFTIDKIIAERKRKRLLSVSAKNFLSVAPVSDASFQAAVQKNLKVIDVTSGDDRADVWFIVVKHKGLESLILFEPDDRFIDGFMRYNRKVVKKPTTERR